MPQTSAKGTLGSILSASQIINEADINLAVAEQNRTGCRFGEALVNLGLVTQEDIDWALSNQLDIPYIRLKKEQIDPEAIRLIPSFLARKHSFIPLIRAGGELNIAIADPLNRQALQEIEHLTGLTASISVALSSEIREMLDRFYGDTGQDSLCFQSASFSDSVIDAINADISGRTLLNYLLVFIIQNRLSSLSIYRLGNTASISGKRSGNVRAIASFAPNRFPEICSLIRRLCSPDQLDLRCSSGMLSFNYRNRLVHFQTAFLPAPEGDFITIRQQIRSRIPARLTELRLPAEQEAAFLKLSKARQGVTFFASRNAEERCRFMDLMLEEMDTAGRQVIILGDGPGRLHKRFPRILLPRNESDRSRTIMDALEHEPDILVIEDATEAAAFTAACRAAMRGKRVLAGLEIRGTWHVLRQMLIYQQKNCFLPVFVNGLVSFKGIQMLCPECRRSYLPPAEEIAAMALAEQPEHFYSSGGCSACGQSGFIERRFLLDTLLFDDEFLGLFEQATDIRQLIAYLDSKGYQGISQQGLQLLLAGEVSPEEYIASIVL